MAARGNFVVDRTIYRLKSHYITSVSVHKNVKPTNKYGSWIFHLNT